MKKLLSIVLCVIIMLGMFSVTSFAENEQPQTYQERILKAVRDMETEFDLYDYKVSSEDVEKFLAFVHQQYPEYYYLEGIAGGTVDKEGNIKKLNLNYSIDKGQMIEDRAFMEAETDKVINKIGKDWSELEKALYIHDWLDVSFMYDYDLFENPGSENHDILSFLKDKRGVCQSYAYTFIYVMHRLNMNAYCVISETDNHAWNVVQIEDNWYHVDATYDDPILGEDYHYDYVGEVRHNKFLLSDSEILADGSHDDFFIPEVEGIVCTEYEGNNSWRNATTAVHKIGDYWYYIDNSKDAGGLVRTKDFKNIEKLMEIGGYNSKYDVYGWYVGGGVYNCYFAGLFEYNGHLFFNTENEIYVYDSHHDVFKALPIDKPEGKTYYGLNMDGKKITYLASGESLMSGVIEGSYTLGVEIVHLTTDWEIITEPTETTEGERVKYCFFCAEIVERQTIPSLSDGVRGDADGNGVVNTNDLAILKLHLVGKIENINILADLNRDGKFDTADLANLKLLLVNL